MESNMNFSLSLEKANDNDQALNDPNNEDGNESDAGSESKDGGGGSKGLDELGGEFQDRNGQHHPIAEFLYQLTKMLTDDNTEIIEWSDGRIKVHHPERLEAEVLHKYFRHSKFASFQRQLNYFGFRKIAGKGKMSPCSYVNEGANTDIRSLLLIKRKTNGSAARKAAIQQRAAAMTTQFNPALLGMNLTSLATANPQMIGGMSGQALSNAMALLSENALRAGLGQLQVPNAANKAQAQASAQLSLLNLQQQQQQLQQQIQQQQQQLQSQQLQQLVNQNQATNEHIAAMFPPQKQPSFPGLGQDLKPLHPGSVGVSNKNPSLQELHAQLAASLAASQQGGPNNGLGGMNGMNGLNAMNGFNLGSMQGNSASNPATAALQAQNMSMPATAAMDAACNTSQASNNLFESAINLKSLLQEHQESVAAAQQRNNASQNTTSMNQVLNRLPSSNGLFPDSMSSVSLGNLLGSSNRLNSLLSLNSFMGSREPSLADFAALNNMAQFAAATSNNNHLQQQQGRNP